MNFNLLWQLMYFVISTNDQSLWNKRVWFEHEQQLHNVHHNLVYLVYIETKNLDTRTLRHDNWKSVQPNL